jgi:hypothetical protein
VDWAFVGVVVQAFSSGAPGDVPWEDWLIAPWCDLMYMVSRYWEQPDEALVLFVGIVVLVFVHQLSLRARSQR